MKKIILISILITTFWSCETVVNVPLDTANPRLVVEAIINWEKDTPGNVQKIKLTTTGNYYGTTVPAVSSANVTVKNSTTNEVFLFSEGSPGEYICSNFNPILNNEYTLEVVSNGVTYVAKEIMKPVVPIKEIKQIKDTGGSTEEETYTLEAYFDDPIDEKNFYMFSYLDTNSQSGADNFVARDEFFNGKEFLSTSVGLNFRANATIEIIHYGISEQYYSYLGIVFKLADAGNNGGMFETTPIPAIGNILNTADKEKNPYGYFALSEVSKKEYTVVDE